MNKPDGREKMRAAGQFAVTPDWSGNAQTCVSMMRQATERGLLLVLPEALLARDDKDADLSVKSAQHLDGGFLQRLLAESANSVLTTVLTVHIPSGPGRYEYAGGITSGKIVAQYQKLHLMMLSISRNPGWSIPGGRSRRLSRSMGCASG
jgi:predicted amidohydrolase